ncbi:MAG: DNA polymerase III subunit gamma/tau [Bacteroidaceae bacterium]|nr:DNA polymerase III subunit gamma/tau [Bacteroidaceae bacterium]
MSEFIVSARKYRPMTFDSVVGQSSICSTLKNAIASGKLAHAYLFCGPRGVGKTTCARIFAKTINCLTPTPEGEACGQCESCKAFSENRSLNIIELDAASNNSVDNIRDLIEQVRIPPQIGRYKVFIIDEVHMLSSQAFNAFLKTLEEPPAHAIFILATTEKHKILPTIISRCQVFDFQRMTLQGIIDHLASVALQEGYSAEPAALAVIAQKADGGMRDALSIFDQAVSFTGGDLTYQRVIENLGIIDYEYYFRMVDAMLNGDITQNMLLYNEVLQQGFEGAPFISGLALHLRDLLMARDAATTVLFDAADNIRSRYAEQAQRCRPQWLYRAIRLCNQCEVSLRTSRNKRLQVELTLIECTQAVNDDDVSAGRRPTVHLKPIFRKPSAVAAGKATPSQSPVPATSVPANSATASEAPSAQQMPASMAQEPVKKLRTVKLGSLSPSIRLKPETTSTSADATAAQPSQQQPSSELAITHLNKPVDAGSLKIKWQEFINSMPQAETALAQCMRIMQPELQEREGKPVAHISLENEELARQMRELQSRLEPFLQKELSNNNLTLAFTVVEKTQSVRVYNKRDQLISFCNQNPALITLGKTFKLELA